MIIETPAMMLDMKKIRNNICNMQKLADENGFKLRPHIKTHKMPELALLQVEAGAVGITCASVSEAECMADNGLKDIFIAYSVVGKNKVERLLDLAERVRIIASADSREGAIAFSDAARRRGMTLEVRLEIDTGMHRAGVPWESAAELAVYISTLPNIRLTGIFTFKSAVYQESPTADYFSAAKEESSIMALTAKKIRAAGVKITDISGGSTPTAEFSGAEAGLTEIRPGTYIFGDVTRIKANTISPEDCAAYAAVTVISTPVPNRAVIDGGAKVFAGDTAQNQPPLYIKGCGYVAGHENLIFSRMSEEHGVLESADGSSTGLRIGQILHVIPNHVCTSVNLFDYAHIINEDGSIRKERILARGLSY